MKRLIFILLLLTAGFHAAAQPADARGYRDNNGMTYGERDMANTAANAAAGNSASPIMKVDQRAVDEMVAAFKANSHGPYINVPPPNKDWESATDKARRAEAARESEYLSRVGAALSKGLLPRLDQEEYVRMAYFCERHYLASEDRITPAKAFMAYLRDSATASYDTLRTRAWAARIFPAAASMCYRDLRNRFPQQKSTTEADEFSSLMYAFGAVRPQVYPEMLAYPESLYELLDESGKTWLLRRFEKLGNTRGNVALTVAGYCRAHINPYLMMAEQPGITDANRAAYYMNVVFTIYPPHSNKLADADYWRTFADRRLRKAAVWMMEHYPERIMKLMKEDWRDIIKSQGISADYVAWAFRESGETKKYQKRIPALYDAWKEAK